LSKPNKLIKTIERIYQRFNMDNCAKCGKELTGFFEKRDKTGQHLPSKYYGKKLCSSCDAQFKEIFEQQKRESKAQQFIDNLALPFKEAKALRREIVNIHYQTLPQTNYIQNAINNHSCIAEQYGYKYKSHSQYPSYMGVVQFTEMDFVFEKIPEPPKQAIQVVLDFSSLKEVMTKGGIVMSTYKCPNCNGMINIPEAGKVLLCQYCGTPIKPVDIFEKIKSLIQ
jgi:ribosomal protein L34E